MFTQKTLPPRDLLKDVQSLGLPVQVRQNDVGTFHGQVGGVDISVFRYRYKLVEPPLTFQGCQLASLKDIAAMKMTAVVQRTTKRDYVDLSALLASRAVTLRDAVSTMQRKYAGVDPGLALRALTYFADVETQPMPERVSGHPRGSAARGAPRLALLLLELADQGVRLVVGACEDRHHVDLRPARSSSWCGPVSPRRMKK